MAIRNKPIDISKDVLAEMSNNEIFVSGPLGKLSLKIHPAVEVKIADSKISVIGKYPKAKQFVGLMRSLINNMVIGVTKGFQKILEIRGTGYRAQKTKDGIQLFLGFTRPVDFSIPLGINIDIKTAPDPDDPKSQMTELIISGIDKYQVGQVAANIRKIKPPDSYKGKGIRYKGEVVKLKPGKKAIAGQT